MTVAVLFARADSVYKTLPGCDVYDLERDARTWPGGCPAVAHPPCRAWGQLRFFAKPRPDEKDLALFAVERVGRWGGVLEHPAQSTLWPVAGLPAPGNVDTWDGWTLVIDQNWWGHRARKRTRLYIVGCRPADIPRMPLVLGEAPRTLGLFSDRGKKRRRPSITKPEREQTPPDLARWLVELAKRCAPDWPLLRQAA